jgi:hypothetical protein
VRLVCCFTGVFLRLRARFDDLAGWRSSVLPQTLRWRPAVMTGHDRASVRVTAHAFRRAAAGSVWWAPEVKSRASGGLNSEGVQGDWGWMVAVRDGSAFFCSARGCVALSAGGTACGRRVSWVPRHVSASRKQTRRGTQNTTPLWCEGSTERHGRHMPHRRGRRRSVPPIGQARLIFDGPAALSPPRPIVAPCPHQAGLETSTQDPAVASSPDSAAVCTRDREVARPPGPVAVCQLALAEACPRARVAASQLVPAAGSPQGPAVASPPDRSAACRRDPVAGSTQDREVACSPATASARIGATSLRDPS